MPAPHLDRMDEFRILRVFSLKLRLRQSAASYWRKNYGIKTTASFYKDEI